METKQVHKFISIRTGTFLPFFIIVYACLSKYRIWNFYHFAIMSQNIYISLFKEYNVMKDGEVCYESE